MSTPRVVTALLAALLCLAGGAYLSGYLTLLLLGLEPGQTDLGTFASYLAHLDHPRVAPYAGRIRVAAVIGFGLMLLCWLAIIAMLVKLRSHHDLHGRARFAGLLDLARKGFLTRSDDGLLVGRMG